MKFFHNSRVAGLHAGLGVEPIPQMPAYKPRGFWFDVDGDWLRWLLGEGYEHDKSWHKPHWYEVVLPRSFRLLRLSSCRAIDAFTEEYGCLPPHAAAWMGRGHYIDWTRVAQSHDGILITPYQWRLRLDDGVRWYYGWDCASGCIWSDYAAVRLRPTTIDAVKSRIVEIPA